MSGFIALGLFVFIGFILPSGERKAEKAVKKETKLHNASLSAVLKHFAGLPIPENTLCQVYSTPSRIEIVAYGQQFNITKEKIIDVSITVNTDSCSIISIIGGRIKTKEVKQVKSYLIFTYQKENETKYVGFDISSGETKAEEFVKEFQKQGRKPLMQINL